MAFGPVSIGGSSYVLPPATKESLGGVIVGDDLTVDEQGKINLPVATADVLGGIKTGDGLIVGEDGNVSIDAYNKTETDKKLNTLQEQVENATAAAIKPIPVWGGDITPNSSLNITLPDSVDYLVIKESSLDDDHLVRYLFPGEEFSRSDYNRNHMKFSTDRVLRFYNDAYGSYNTRNYLIGYHKESYADGVKIPQIVGYKIVSNSYNDSSFTVDDTVDYVVMHWKTTKSVIGGDSTASVEVSNSAMRFRGASCGLFNFSQNGKLSVPGTKNNYVSTTFYYTFYHYITPEELAAQQTATQSAQADTNAMMVDQEYRIAMLELGASESENEKTE